VSRAGSTGRLVRVVFDTEKSLLQVEARERGPAATVPYNGRVTIRVEVSAGELIDRICILELKVQRLAPLLTGALERQLSAAVAVREQSIARSPALARLTQGLYAANVELWESEEALRKCEHEQSFGPHFVALARAVYRTNDRRAALKRQIDELVGSPIREHKSYALPEL